MHREEEEISGQDNEKNKGRRDRVVSTRRQGKISRGAKRSTSKSTKDSSKREDIVEVGNDIVSIVNSHINSSRGENDTSETTSSEHRDKGLSIESSSRGSSRRTI